MFKWIAIGIGVLAAIGAAWYFVSGGGPAQRSKRSQCEALKAQRDAARARGDANAVASLEAQIAQCDAALAASGDRTANPMADQLSGCINNFTQVYPILSDIIATDRSDWLARGNKWRNALHFATDGQQCLASVAQQVTTKDDLAALRTAVREWGTKMRAVQNRLYAASHGGESGLDAYSGSPEPGGDDKAHAWLVSVVDPLWQTLSVVDHKLSALDASNQGLTAELAALAATPSAPANGVFGP